MELKRYFFRSRSSTQTLVIHTCAEILLIYHCCKKTNSYFKYLYQKFSVPTLFHFPDRDTPTLLEDHVKI